MPRERNTILLLYLHASLQFHFKNNFKNHPSRSHEIFFEPARDFDEHWASLRTNCSVFLHSAVSFGIRSLEQQIFCYSSQIQKQFLILKTLIKSVRLTFPFMLHFLCPMRHEHVFPPPIDKRQTVSQTPLNIKRELIQV